MLKNARHVAKSVLSIEAPECRTSPKGAANMRQLLVNCLRDEQGQEVIEYALLLGLVVIGALGVMSALGIKVVDRWTRLADSL
jgi:Flp pilus assembly pilin Flp